MSYPHWPETLPTPLKDGFSAELTPGTRRVQMESGPDRVTRISSTSMSTNSYSIFCKSEQAAEFDSFFNVSANAGTDWVIIPMVTSNELLPHKCRIVGPIRREPMGLEWRISFTLETAEQLTDWSV